jgi:hypothetical protein
MKTNVLTLLMRLRVSLIAATLKIGVWLAIPVWANTFFFSTGNADGRLGALSRSTRCDPVDAQTLSVMPWPIYRNMMDRDLEAIYSYLSAIPSATPRPPGMHCANSRQ